MECVICKNGRTKPGKVTVTVELNKTVVIIRDVSAKVCNNCGNYYLSSEMAKIVSGKVKEAVKKGVEVEIIRLSAA